MTFERKRQIAVGFVVVVALTGFICFRYLPIRNQIIRLKQGLKKQQLVIDSTSSKSQQLMSLKQILTKMQSELVNYDSCVPNEMDLTGFLKQMAEMMENENLSQKKVSPETEISYGQVRCLPIKIQCKGTIEQLFNFCKALDNSQRIIRIEQVTIDNDEKYSGQLLMQTQAFIYCQK